MPDNVFSFTLQNLPVRENASFRPLLFCCLNVSAQSYFSVDCSGESYPPQIIDSFDFDNQPPEQVKFIIDTTFPDNLWQVGTIQFSSDSGSSRRYILQSKPQRYLLFRLFGNHVSAIIEVYNSIGQRLILQSLYPTIDISHLPKGVYHYSVKFSKTG